MIDGEFIGNEIDDGPAVEHLGCIELLSEYVPATISYILNAGSVKYSFFRIRSCETPTAVPPTP